MKWFINLLKQWFETTTPVPNPTPSPIPANNWQVELLRLHNEERVSRGLSPLVWNTKLQVACQGWADYMAASHRMVHSNVGNIISKAGYSWSRCGENIAWGYNTPASVMAGWMSSSGHKANILGNYKDVAICYARSGNTLYWCADFASPKGGNIYEELVDFESEPQLSGPRNGHVSELFGF